MPDIKDILKNEDFGSIVGDLCVDTRENRNPLWGIERSGFFNGREKWAKDFENQRV